MKCKYCGTVNNEAMKFCKYCGKELLDDKNISSSNKKSVFNRIIIVLIVITIIAIAGMVSIIIFSNLDSSATSEKKISDNRIETIENTFDETTIEETTVKLVKVPDVVGLKSDDAIKKLEAVNLKYNMLLEESGTVDIDYVVSQSPTSEKEIAVGETVTVYVSKSDLSNQSSDLSDSISIGIQNIMYCCASDFATLRDVPSRTGKSLAKIDSRDSVTWISTTGEFYYVRYNNKLGYVLKDFFSSDYDAPLNYGTGNP